MVNKMKHFKEFSFIAEQSISNQSRHCGEKGLFDEKLPQSNDKTESLPFPPTRAIL